MSKLRTAAKRKTDAERSRRWRLAHPERARANNAKYRERHPLTAEQRARKSELNRAWRLKNAARIKREHRQRWEERREEINAKRRAKYAANPARERERLAAWKAAHPDHNRRFYHRHRESFTGDGRWSKRTKRTNRMKRAWRTFTKTCAATRATIQEIA